MASYFDLTLDTLAPAGLTAKLNGDAQYTTSRTVTLTVALTDEETTGYQMKVWGLAGAADEADASWETFAAEKSVTLPEGDGLKTVHVKVRDDVGNESAAVSDSITLDTAVPAVTITGPDRSKIPKVDSFNKAIFSFSADMAFEEYKVCVVPQSSATQDSGTLIPTDGGSLATSGSDGGYPAATPIQVTVTGTDLETASGGDGVKIVKVFVRTASGSWSVA